MTPHKNIQEFSGARRGIIPFGSPDPSALIPRWAVDHSGIFRAFPAQAQTHYKTNCWPPLGHGSEVRGRSPMHVLKGIPIGMLRSRRVDFGASRELDFILKLSSISYKLGFKINLPGFRDPCRNIKIPAETGQPTNAWAVACLFSLMLAPVPPGVSREVKKTKRMCSLASMACVQIELTGFGPRPSCA